MLKNLFLAVALVILTGGLVAVVVVYFADGGERVARPDGRDLLEPSATPVLAGTDGALEILVKRRLPGSRSNDFADARLATRLGIDSRSHAFLEILVVNIGSRPLRVDLGSLKLETAAGETFGVESLRKLARKTASSEVLLATHSPDPTRLLGPGRLRRGLVAVVREVVLERVTGGTLSGVSLSAHEAGSTAIEGWLERPRRVLLTAVLGEEAIKKMKADEPGNLNR